MKKLSVFLTICIVLQSLAGSASASEAMITEGDIISEAINSDAEEDGAAPEQYEEVSEEGYESASGNEMTSDDTVISEDELEVQPEVLFSDSDAPIQADEELIEELITDRFLGDPDLIMSEDISAKNTDPDDPRLQYTRDDCQRIDIMQPEGSDVQGGSSFWIYPFVTVLKEEKAGLTVETQMADDETSMNVTFSNMTIASFNDISSLKNEIDNNEDALLFLVDGGQYYSIHVEHVDVENSRLSGSVTPFSESVCDTNNSYSGKIRIKKELKDKKETCKVDLDMTGDWRFKYSWTNGAIFSDSTVNIELCMNYELVNTSVSFSPGDVSVSIPIITIPIIPMIADIPLDFVLRGKGSGGLEYNPKGALGFKTGYKEHHDTYFENLSYGPENKSFGFSFQGEVFAGLSVGLDVSLGMLLGLSGGIDGGCVFTGEGSTDPYADKLDNRPEGRRYHYCEGNNGAAIHCFSGEIATRIAADLNVIIIGVKENIAEGTLYQKKLYDWHYSTVYPNDTPALSVCPHQGYRLYVHVNLDGKPIEKVLVSYGEGETLDERMKGEGVSESRTDGNGTAILYLPKGDGSHKIKLKLPDGYDSLPPEDFLEQGYQEKTKNLVQSDLTIDLQSYPFQYDANCRDNVTDLPPNRVDYAKSGSAVSYTIPNNIPVRKGYDFLGWGSNQSDPVYQPGDTLTTNQGITFYAIWTPTEYTVRFDQNTPAQATHAVKGIMAPEELTHAKKQDLNVNIYELIGWKFRGWNTKKDGTGTPYKDCESVMDINTKREKEITLYAQWEAGTYQVHFKSDGGDGAMKDQILTYDSPADLIPNSFTKKQHLFGGWSNDLLFGSFYDDQAHVMNLCGDVVGDVTLTAIWLENTHSGIIITDNGNAITGIQPEKDIVLTKEGASSSQKPFRLRTGTNAMYVADHLEAGTYKISFTGNLAAYDPGIEPFVISDDEIELYRFDYCTVSLEGDAHGTAVIDDSQELFEKEHVRIGKKLPIRTDVDSGYVFVDYAADGEMPEWDPDEKTAKQEILVNGRVTIKAATKPAVYTVSFDGNRPGKASHEVTETMADLKMTYDEEQTLPPHAYSLEGWQFCGWNTAADGSGTSYADRDSVKNLTTQDNGRVVLYAQWLADTYHISYDLTGGNADPKNPDIYTYEDTITLTNPVRKGYVFTGWTGSNGSVPQKNIVISKYSRGDRNYTANWTEAKGQMILSQGVVEGDRKVKITWTKVPTAAYYTVSVTDCDPKAEWTKSSKIKDRKYTFEAKGSPKTYRFYVAAYSASGKQIGRSPDLHIAMPGAGLANAEKIVVQKNDMKLGIGKKKKIKASVIMESDDPPLHHEKQFRYYSSDPAIATVSKKGKVKGVSTGSCSIYIIANNGVRKKVNVSVS